MVGVKLTAVIIKMGVVVMDSIDDGDTGTTCGEYSDCGDDKSKVGFSSESAFA